MTASRAGRVIAVGAILGVLAACGADPASEPTTTTAPTTSTSSSAPTTSSTIAPSTTTSSSVPAQVGDLFVIGDWGSGTMPQGAVAGAMMRYAEAEAGEVEAILTTGDNFYSDDWEFLMDPYGWAEESGIPFWITWGNHDIESEQRIEAVNTAFDDPPRWTVRQWGAVDVVILDSTQIESEEQLAFLEETLASSGRPTVIVAHHPPYSCGSHGDHDEISYAWLPEFDGDVVLMLSGHEHTYQRFEDGGITYTVTGGGGARLTDLQSCDVGHPERIAGESINHFLVIEQEGDSLDVSAVDVIGEVFDEFSVELG